MHRRRAPASGMRARSAFGARRDESAVLTRCPPVPNNEVAILRSDLKGLGDYGTVGLDLVLSILFGFFGGRWLDGKLGTHGWLTVIGFGFGVIAGFLSLYRAAIKMRKETEAEDQRERQARRGRGRDEGDDGEA